MMSLQSDLLVGAVGGKTKLFSRHRGDTLFSYHLTYV